LIENPDEIISELLKSQLYSLARKLAHNCTLSQDVTLKIEKKYLLALLRLATSNTSQIGYHVNHNQLN